MSSSRAAFPTEASPVSAAWVVVAWGPVLRFPFGLDGVLISFFLSLRLDLACDSTAVV
jgi:hypothetical protein